MMGADFQVVPNETFRIHNDRYSDWKNCHFLDWREQTITLDFAKSLHPTKLFFDAEWHDLLSNAWGNI
ncbi:hypothetical protein [Flavobacterium algicola]|uniref:hypothetical protein n=1 Tax=Flavobacterium algicola TaxID=556529 RepID=UPI001EFED2D8|nr:hypothetical protein [Flavobacterium algicola]MCG9793736.1 hypothetical protein [Flavobacterium algicola]